MRSTVFVAREGNFTRSGLDYADEIEIFEGGENQLKLAQTYSKVFHCTYLLHFFPFDTQVCYIHMRLEDFYHTTTELLPDKMNLRTNRKLPQYIIQSWNLAYIETGEKTINNIHEILYFL